jgi:hypothetical protein
LDWFGDFGLLLSSGARDGGEATEPSGGL